MTENLPTQSTAATAPRALSASQLLLVQNTLAKGCTKQEFDLFIEMAKKHGLDPIKRQIYAIVTNPDNPKKRHLAIVTGIDGYRAKAARCGNYRPDEDEPEYSYTEKDPETNPVGLDKAVVSVYRRDADGVWNRVRGIAWWDEHAPLKEVWENGKPTGRMHLQRGTWQKMPRLMLAKCAEAQALRKGWPEEFGGLHVAEELDSAVASQVIEQEEKNARIAIASGLNTVPLQFEAGHPIEYVPVGQVFDRVTEFLSSVATAEGIDSFVNLNQMGLREYWALEKNDALALKVSFEERRDQLKAGGEGAG